MHVLFLETNGIVMVKFYYSIISKVHTKLKIKVNSHTVFISINYMNYKNSFQCLLESKKWNVNAISLIFWRWIQNILIHITLVKLHSLHLVDTYNTWTCHITYTQPAGYIRNIFKWFTCSFCFREKTIIY